MLAVAALGWSRRGSGIDGANGMERAEVGQAKVLRVGGRFIVEVVDVAIFSGDESVSSGVLGDEDMTQSSTRSPAVSSFICR